MAFATLGARCIESTEIYTDLDGYTHVAGEMVNETDISARTVTLQATLFDAQNNVIAQATGPLCPESVQPHSRNSFDIRFPTPGMTAASRYEVRPISGLTVPDTVPDSGVEILGFDARRFANVAVRADIRNNSANTYTNMSVCVAFYNAAGRVVHVFSGSVEGPLAPGADKHFGFTDTGYVRDDAASAALWLIAAPDKAWVFHEKEAFTTEP